MKPLIDFGDLLTGLQQLPEREKIILVALINAVRIAQNGELAKIERLVGQSVIAAARDNCRDARVDGKGARRRDTEVHIDRIGMGASRRLQPRGRRRERGVRLRHRSLG